jgi:hypothetical protein
MGRDRDCAPAVHGLAGVLQEVHEHQGEVGALHHQRRQGRGVVALEANVEGDPVREHLAQGGLELFDDLDPFDAAFDESERELGEAGITIAHVDRTPFQKLQIDFAGLEAFSYHLADEEASLFELLELMNSLKLEEFACVARSKAEYIKLWENIGIDAVGPQVYRRHLVPVYEGIIRLLEGSGKRLLLHYDGKLRLIAGDIARLGFDIDSLTPPPEGDMEGAEARALWPESFLWLHPSLTLFDLPEEELAARFTAIARAVGPRRYCFEISEGVPPNWERGIPAVLKGLASL